MDIQGGKQCNIQGGELCEAKSNPWGIIDVSWTYRKVKLLNIKISELELEHEHYRNIFYYLYIRAGGQ